MATIIWLPATAWHCLAGETDSRSRAVTATRVRPPQVLASAGDLHGDRGPMLVCWRHREGRVVRLGCLAKRKEKIRGPPQVTWTLGASWFCRSSTCAWSHRAPPAAPRRSVVTRFCWLRRCTAKVISLAASRGGTGTNPVPTWKTRTCAAESPEETHKFEVRLPSPRGAAQRCHRSPLAVRRAVGTAHGAAGALLAKGRGKNPRAARGRGGRLQGP